jgi:predicted transcriptional regulator
MSINPEHVSNILAGTKKYEFRKIKCKRKIESIIIYSTAPEMKVVAEVEVTDLIQGTPNDVWKKTSKNAGIKKRFFDSYFHNRETAFAYCLGKVKKVFTVQRITGFWNKNSSSVIRLHRQLKLSYTSIIADKKPDFIVLPAQNTGSIFVGYGE